MPDNIIFYAVFLSQIFLVSYYFPKKMLRRLTYVFETYPPAQYPRLYPKPIAYYEKARRNYRNMNGLILLAGLLLLVVMLIYPQSGEWDVVFPYFMLQFLPMILIEKETFKHYKLMRKANSSATRKAELHPRRFFDFISPIMFSMAILVYIAFIAFILYFRQFGFPWFGGYLNIAIVTAANLFFAGIIVWNMYGKKQDPYQAYEDRKRHIAFIVKQMVFISIAMTVYAAINIVLSSLDLRHLNPVVMSLYFQLIAVISLQTLRMDNINFEVYKADPSQENTEKMSNMMTEETDENEKNFHIYTGVGLGFGLSFGVALGLTEGATFSGLVLIGGIGSGIGMILGMAMYRILHFRKGNSPTI